LFLNQVRQFFFPHSFFRICFFVFIFSRPCHPKKKINTYDPPPGDMQLTRTELTETQVIVTTPEKWDVITRKSTDVALTQIVRLLIIDEVHLLNEGRIRISSSSLPLSSSSPLFLPYPPSFLPLPSFPPSSLISRHHPPRSGTSSLVRARMWL
jgi:hypothetical protein